MFCALECTHACPPFLQVASIVGNETSVESGRVVPPHYNLQGDLIYPGGASTTPEEVDKDLEAGVAEAAPPARVADFDIFAPSAPPCTLLHKVKVCFFAARVVLLTLAMDAGTATACWAPASVALAAFMGFLEVRCAGIASA